MNRLMLLLAVLVALSLISVQSAWADDPPGANLFNTYCAACHGKEGKGGGAPAIGDPTYLSTHDEATMIQITGSGTSKGMPSWSKAKGGMLSDDQIAGIIAYLRGETAPAAAVAQPAAPAQPVQVYVETKLALSQNTDYDGNPVLLANVHEYDGYPVEGATVAFSRQTAFGTQDLGTVKTDWAGYAPLTVPGLTTGSQITAVFKGVDKWNASQNKMTLAAPQMTYAGVPINPAHVSLSVDEPLLEPEGSLITPNPPLIPATLFVMVVAGVWSLYAYVVSQVLGIRNEGAPVVRENMLRFGAKPPKNR